MPDVTGARGAYRLDGTEPRKGGQAEVLAGVAPDGRRVAIKLPLATRNSGWFTREANLLRQLTQVDRPWVVPLLDEGVTPDGRPFIVLPWYEEALDEWLEHRPAIERIFEALTLACESVVRLHRAPVDLANVLVHRDVKPYNFLVRDDGAELSVVLADLGIAKEGRLAEASTQTGLFTEYYAPPEQQLPLAIPPDPAMDVHGLAATVWFGICDRVPRAMFSRQAAWLDDAADLRALAMLGTKRSAADEAKFEEMRRRPIEAYADFEQMTALKPQDEQEFVQRLEAGLASRVQEPGAVARSVADRLLPVLRRGLDPDHRRRIGEAQRLYAAVRQARDQVVAALANEGPGVAAKAPVVVSPGGATLIPNAGAETFNPREPAGGGDVPTGGLPTLQLDDPIPTAPPAPRPAPPPQVVRIPPRTNDPSRTIDPFADVESEPRRGWALVAAAVSFAGVLGVVLVAVGGWWLYGGTSEPTAVEAPAAPTPEADANTTVVPPDEPPPDAPIVEQPPEGPAEKPGPEEASLKPKPPPDEPPVVPPPPEPTPAVAEAPPAILPVTLTVLRCQGHVDPGELKVDGNVAAGDTVAVNAGTTVLSVKTVGGTEAWTTINVKLDEAGLQVRGQLRALDKSRGATLLLDPSGKLVGSRRECP